MEGPSRPSWGEFGNSRKIHREVSIIPLLWFHYRGSTGGSVERSVNMEVPTRSAECLPSPYSRNELRGHRVCRDVGVEQIPFRVTRPIAPKVQIVGSPNIGCITIIIVRKCSANYDHLKQCKHSTGEDFEEQSCLGAIDDTASH
jgi:hypothetical protein